MPGGVDAQAGEVARRVAQLLPQRLHVVGVHVGVAQHVHKVARPQPTHLVRKGGTEGEEACVYVERRASAPALAV